MGADGPFLPAAGMRDCKRKVPNRSLFRPHGQPLTTRCGRWTADQPILKPDIQSTATPLHPYSAPTARVVGRDATEHCSEQRASTSRFASWPI